MADIFFTMTVHRTNRQHGKKLFYYKTTYSYTENKVVMTRSYFFCFILLTYPYIEQCFTRARNRGSYMSAHVLLNLLNKLEKRDKMQGLPSFMCRLYILYIWCYQVFVAILAPMILCPVSLFNITVYHFAPYF